MSRLIVKNIPNTMSENHLRQHFEEVGEVTDVKVMFKGQKNRRFCFVGYKNEADAQTALKKFNKTYIGMSKIDVEWAHTKDDPNLPRAWSRYTPKEEKQKAVVKQDEQPTAIKEAPTKNEKFEEFERLVKQQSMGTMAWNDIQVNGRQKKEIKSQKKKEELTKKLDEIFDEVKQVQVVKQDEQKPADSTKSPVDSKRLYVTNIPYNSTDQEIKNIFDKYGQVQNLKVPKGRGGTLTGFCFVTYSSVEEAMRAYAELNNKIVMGRILHLKPAFEDDKPQEALPIQPEAVENSSYKKSKKKDMLNRLEDQTNWNTLFLNPNSILEAVAQKYNLKKRDILSEEGDEIAVRVALAETQIIKETKDWLKSIGINLDFLDTERGQCERSTNTILVKNIQFKVDENQLNEVFSRFGKVTKTYLAPNRALGIVTFENELHAQNAFKNLSYFKYQGSYFYLEWAPKAMLKEKPSKNQMQIEEEDTLTKIVYVKNLNFNTEEKALEKIFSEYNTVSTKIVRRDGLSLGYGFVEFSTAEEAGKALRKLQNVLLDDHNLQLSQSKPKKQQETNQRKAKIETKPSTKLVMRNLAFEANLKEIKSLVKNYGECKKVRLPKKLDGQHRGFCFVEFTSLEEAKNAYEALQNTHFYGRRLVVEFSQDNIE